ncbi:hypothetical protein MnTg04_01483 [bacterium MnTg04]|nr:hypothetical protein MnTg04_01483 [bacterium MnTg04]
MTGEIARYIQFDRLLPLLTKLAGRLGLAPLAIHRLLETLAVDAQAFFPGYIGRQVQRKTVGIIQLEHRVAGYLLALEPGNHCF